MPGRLLSFVVTFCDLHSSDTSLPKQVLMPTLNFIKLMPVVVFDLIVACVHRRGRVFYVWLLGFTLTHFFVPQLTDMLLPLSTKYPTPPSHLYYNPFLIVSVAQQYHKLCLAQTEKKTSLFPFAFKKDASQTNYWDSNSVGY